MVLIVPKGIGIDEIGGDWRIEVAIVADGREMNGRGRYPYTHALGPRVSERVMRDFMLSKDWSSGTILSALSGCCS